MSGGVRVDGLNELQEHLRRVGVQLQDMPVFADLAQRMAALARSYAPARTGRLARSIRPEDTPNRASIVATEPYAATINYGSTVRNIRPRKFMQRVDPAITGQAVNAVTAAVERIINQGAK